MLQHCIVLYHMMCWFWQKILLSVKHKLCKVICQKCVTKHQVQFTLHKVLQKIVNVSSWITLCLTWSEKLTVVLPYLLDWTEHLE